MAGLKSHEDGSCLLQEPFFFAGRSRDGRLPRARFVSLEHRAARLRSRSKPRRVIVESFFEVRLKLGAVDFLHPGMEEVRGRPV